MGELTSDGRSSLAGSGTTELCSVPGIGRWGWRSKALFLEIPFPLQPLPLHAGGSGLHYN